MDSFEVDLDIPCVGDAAVRAIFIRAPYITQVRDGVEVLASLDTQETVMVRQGNCLATAFHPELTSDTRIHEYFVDMTVPTLAASRR